MAYALCVKPNDNNLLHIIQESHLIKACYRNTSYHVVAIAQSEEEAFAVVADFVRAFCVLKGIENLRAAEFAKWIAGDAL